MTPTDIEHVINEEIIASEYEPANVRTEVEAFLATLDDSEETAAAVYNQARAFASARHDELVMRDGDLERVVAIFDAVLEPMLRWLAAKAGMSDPRRYVFDKIDGWRT